MDKHDKINLTVINLWIVLFVVLAFIMIPALRPVDDDIKLKSGDGPTKKYSNVRLRDEGFSEEKADQLSDVISKFQQQQKNK